MNWRSPLTVLLAFMVAGLGMWFGPVLLIPLGLGEFAFVGQVCLTILALSVLEAVLTRLHRF